MRRRLSRRWFAATALSLPLLAATGCTRAAPIDDAIARTARGPVTVWFSYDQFELQWADALVTAWNQAHPDEPVQAQEVPAGSSAEEVITAAIAAGTTPDLIFNIAMAPLPAWIRSGGLVNLSGFEDAHSYIEQRTGAARARSYTTDGDYYVLPWKSGPVMIMYNKSLFAAAGLDPEDPGMETHEAFLAKAARLVESGTVPSAIWPSPSGEFYRPWYDFYPLFLAQTDGTRLVEDGRATFDGPEGLAIARFWEQLYRDGIAPQEEPVDDAMATSRTAMQITGPWAVAAYRDLIDVGFMPVPTIDARGADEIVTFADSKNISMFTTCRHRATAWDFAKFATSLEQDRSFLEISGQMPLRENLLETFSDYFVQNPLYAGFGSQSARTVEVPTIPNSIQTWQRFRNAYSSSVIFADRPVGAAFADAADAIEELVAGIA